MGAGEDMEHGDLLGVEAGVVAGAEAPGILRGIEAVGSDEPVDEGVESGAGAGAVDDELGTVEPANHVEIHHRHRIGQRHGGVGGVVGATEEAPFLTGEGDEEDAAGIRPLLGEDPRHLDEHRRATAVVVGAVVDRRIARRGGIAPAVAEMVVMGAEDHRLGGEDRLQGCRGLPGPVRSCRRVGIGTGMRIDGSMRIDRARLLAGRGGGLLFKIAQGLRLGRRGGGVVVRPGWGGRTVGSRERCGVSRDGGGHDGPDPRQDRQDIAGLGLGAVDRHTAADPPAHERG